MIQPEVRFLVGLGGTGGRVLAHLESDEFDDLLYLDSYDERDGYPYGVEIDKSSFRMTYFGRSSGEQFLSRDEVRHASEAASGIVLQRLKAAKLRSDSKGLPLRVVVVASLAGNTGSGLSPSIVRQCSAHLTSERHRISGYFCSLPSYLRRSDSLGQQWSQNVRDAVSELTRNRPPDDLHLLSDDSCADRFDPASSEVFSAPSPEWVADFVRYSLEGSSRPPVYSAPLESTHRRVLADVEMVNDELLSHLHTNPHLIYEFSPRKFEELVAKILDGLGYEVTLTQKTRDGGKDLYAVSHSELGSHLYLVECKRYSPERPVGVDVVRSLYGVVKQEQATMGVVVTTSTFTRPAEKFQRVVRYGLSLRDYQGLTAWLDKYFANR